jgi:Rho termination factor-like protein
MKTHMTIDQLEQMKTHELADMLANVVLLLRRMPDIECKQLVQQLPSDVEVEQPTLIQVAEPSPSFTREELTNKKVPELKALAKELKVLLPNGIKKDDLIKRILARSADGRSEQRAIQDL